jgi:hypothetical protein
MAGPGAITGYLSRKSLSPTVDLPTTAISAEYCRLQRPNDSGAEMPARINGDGEHLMGPMA